MKLTELLSDFDLDQIEIEDQGFFETDYELEIYYDRYEWNGAGTDRTGSTTCEGNIVSPESFLNEDGSINRDDYHAAIRRKVQNGLDDEERAGPIYVVG